MKHWLWVLALIVIASSCRSSDEEIRDVVRNYLETDVVHAAHQRAYTYLSSADKTHTNVDAYAKSRVDQVPLPDATFTIDAVEAKGDRINVKVTTTASPGSPDVETTFVVLEEFDGKHRVYLGLKEIDDIRTKLDDARRLGEEGGLEKAKEILEQVKASPFRGSQPERYETEIELTDRAVKRRESRKSLDKRIGEALKMNIVDLEAEISALKKVVPEDDKEMMESLENLKGELGDRKKKAALENFVFSNLRVRNLLNASGAVAPFVTFKARNNTKRPLSALKVEIRLVNEPGGTALGQAQFDLVAKGKVMEPQTVIPFEKELKNKPVDWRGREVEVVATDLVFADNK